MARTPLPTRRGAPGCPRLRGWGPGRQPRGPAPNHDRTRGRLGEPSRAPAGPALRRTAQPAARDPNRAQASEPPARHSLRPLLALGRAATAIDLPASQADRAIAAQGEGLPGLLAGGGADLLLGRAELDRASEPAPGGGRIPGPGWREPSPRQARLVEPRLRCRA